MAQSAVEKYTNLELSKNDAKTKAIIDCLLDCEIFDMTALLRIVNNVPYLRAFYNNPRSQYQHQTLNHSRAYTVWNEGVRQVVYDQWRI